MAVPSKNPQKGPSNRPPAKPQSPKEYKAEEMNISRFVDYYENQRDKLTKLKEEVLGAKRDTLRSKIINNTIEELKRLSVLSEQRIEEIARDLVDNLIDAFSENDTTKFDEKMQKLSMDVRQQRRFYLYLNEHGSIEYIEKIRNLKKNPEIDKYLKSKPNLKAEFDAACDSGDYEAVKRVLKRISFFGKRSDEELDQFLGAFMLQSQLPDQFKLLDFIPIVGKKLSSWAADIFKVTDRVMKAGRIKIDRQAAMKLGVQYSTLVRLRVLTIAELKDRVETFDKYKSWLLQSLEEEKDPKKKKRIEIYLKAIKETEVLYEALNQQIFKNEAVKSDIIRAVDEYLRNKTGITPEDRAKIMADMQLDTLKIGAVLPFIVKGKSHHEQESNLYWFSQFFIHWGKAKRAYHLIKPNSLDRAMTALAFKRLKEQSIRKLRQQLRRNPGATGIINQLNDLDNKVSNYRGSIQNEDVLGQGKNRSSFVKDSWGHHDIMRRYQVLNEKASDFLTDQAKRLSSAGHEMDTKLRGLASESKIPSSRFSQGTLKELGLSNRKSFSPIEMKKALIEKTMNLKELQHNFQRRFAATSAEIRRDVIDPYDRRWANEINRPMHEDMKGRVKDIHYNTTWKGKALRALRVLPGVAALSTPIIDMMRGKADVKEIKYDLVELGGGFLPFLGTFFDWRRVFTGKTLSGREISTKEQILSGIFGTIGIVSDVATVIAGPIGVALRGWMGGVRAGRRLASSGELLRSTSQIQDAYGITTSQKLYRKLASKFSSARAAENALEGQLKGGIYRFMQARQTLLKHNYKNLDNLTTSSAVQKEIDMIVNAGKARSMSQQLEALREYKQMLDKTGNIDNLTKLRQSFGITEDIPRFAATRNNVEKGINYLRSGTGARRPGDLQKLNRMEEAAAHHRIIRDERRSAEMAYRKALDSADPKSIKEAQEALAKVQKAERDIIGTYGSYANLQNRVYASVEGISRTSVFVTKAARIMQYAGMGLGVMMLLQGFDNTAEKLVEKGIDGLAWAGEKGVEYGGKVSEIATKDYTPPTAFDTMVEEISKSRIEERRFAGKVMQIERSQLDDKKKKEAIEKLCAYKWDNSYVKAWAYRHLDKVDINKIRKYRHEYIRNPQDFMKDIKGDKLGLTLNAKREILTGDSARKNIEGVGMG